jgi:hypothetical protein
MKMRFKLVIMLLALCPAVTPLWAQDAGIQREDLIFRDITSIIGEKRQESFQYIRRNRPGN